MRRTELMTLAPSPGSGFGDVVEIAVGADRLAGFDHGHGGLAADPLCFLEQDIVASQAEAVIHGISLAPAHQVLAREAAVAAQQDVDIGPAFPDHRDDAPDLVARTPGAIDVGGSELGEQEMAAAEDIEGQQDGAFLRRRDRTARPPRVVHHYSSAVNNRTKLPSAFAREPYFYDCCPTQYFTLRKSHPMWRSSAPPKCKQSVVLV